LAVLPLPVRVAKESETAAGSVASAGGIAKESERSVGCIFASCGVA
jgi:hypothetical protein